VVRRVFRGPALSRSATPVIRPPPGNLREGCALSYQRDFLSPISTQGFIMSSHMPPIPPANRSKKGGNDPETSKDAAVKQPEHHHNAAEEGDTANIKQNTTNKGFFRGRRMG
jgi:hypothetical protein